MSEPGIPLLIGAPTPLPISVDSPDFIDHALGTISHSILASSNPGAASVILKSSDEGHVQLVRIGVGKAPVEALDILGNVQLTGTLLHPEDLVILAGGGDVLLADTNIQSHHWVSGAAGWGITHAGHADFRNITADSLTVAAFVADTNLALAGSQMITKSVAVVSRPFTIPAVSDTLYVYDLPGFASLPVFANGDTLCLRFIDRSGGELAVGDVWGTVTGYANLGEGEQSWTWTTVTGSAGQLVGAGQTALDYGQSGDGYWHVTTLDPTGSPYAEVGTWQSDPSIMGNHTIHLRIGQLDGIAGVGDEWGFWTGQDTDKYLLLSDHTFAAHGLRLSLYDSSKNEALRLDPGTPSLALGYPLPGGPNAGGDGLWAGKVGTVYQLRLGDPAGTALRWDGASLTFRNSSNADVIVLNNAGAAYFAGPMTLGTNGGIYQGTGSFGTPSTGLKIWRDGSIGRIGGYNSGSLQWYANTDGKLYAGGGNVIMDSNGVTIASGAHWPSTNTKNKLRFGMDIGEIFATSGMDSTRFRLQMSGGEAFIQFTNELITDEYITFGGKVNREHGTNQYEICFPHFLSTKATSAYYNGDNFSTGTSTIDLSTRFGLPAGIKAINATLIVSSNGNAVTDYVWLGPSASPGDNQLKSQTHHGNNQVYESGIVKCSASGDIFMTVNASTTVRIWIEIWAIYI